MVKFAALASGSAANSYFFRVGETRVLIDAGLNAEQTDKRLSAIGERFRDINAVLLGHSHGDHFAGLPILTKKYHKPLYATSGTISEIDEELRRFAPRYEVITSGKLFSIGSIDGFAFPVQHDTTEPVGFIFQGEGVRIGIATDLGKLDTVAVLNAFPSCDLIFTESNHDPDTLAVGPYPSFLKERVARHHLSNQDTCDFIREHLTNKTSTLILGHISSNNNDPRLVKLMAQKALVSRTTRLIIAEPNKQLEPIIF